MLNPYHEKYTIIRSLINSFMSNYIRTFAAIEVPENIKRTALEIQEDLKKYNCRVSWTKAAGMHLTVKFLGDTEESKIEDIGSAFSDVCGNYSGFNLKLTETGVFGGKRPSVIWLGLSFPDELSNFQKDIDKAAEKFGFEPEKRQFHPHLTLARIKDTHGVLPMIEQFRNIELEKFSFTADELILLRSDLKPSGAVYTPLKQMKFKL